MKFALTNDLLVQIETELNKNEKLVYRVVTFFRHTYQVHVSVWYEHYDDALILYENAIKTI